MERVIRPGVFVLAAVIWGLLFLGEAVLCTGDVADSNEADQRAPAVEQADGDDSTNPPTEQ